MEKFKNKEKKDDEDEEEEIEVVKEMRQIHRNSHILPIKETILQFLEEPPGCT